MQKNKQSKLKSKLKKQEKGANNKLL